MMKKLIVIIMTVIFALQITVTAFANGVSTCDISGYKKTSKLTIIGKNATCESEYLGVDKCSSISVVQTLEKHSWFFFWDVVGEACTKTVNNAEELYFTNYKYNLNSGTYRVKSVFTVKLNDGKSETVTVYSDEKTIS